MSWLAFRLDTILTRNPSRMVQEFERLTGKVTRAYFKLQLLLWVYSQGSRREGLAGCERLELFSVLQVTLCLRLLLAFKMGMI